MTSSLKAILEFVPIVLFVIAYNLYGMTMAVKVMVACTVLTVAFLYIKKEKVSGHIMLGYASILVFGGLTIYMDDPMFIKIKPTFMNLLFAGVLLYDFFLRKKDRLLAKLLPFLNSIPAHALKKTYMIWVCYFVLCAALNEFIWRNYSEETWVYFKAFGSFALNVVFIAVNIIVLKKVLGANSDESYFRTKK